MKIKTAELEGAALDWAVTKSLYGEDTDYVLANSKQRNAYSTDPAQGWPIVQNEPVTSGPHLHLGWFARSFGDATNWYGRTRLIASLRCYVASRLGDEVEVPDGLQ